MNNCIRPVYIKDVVAAIIVALESKATIGNVYDLAGKEALSFNAFIDAICIHLNLKKCKLHLPFRWCMGIAKFVQLVYPKSLLGPNTLKRMVENPPLNIEPAIKDLGFHPIDLQQGLIWALAGERTREGTRSL